MFGLDFLIKYMSKGIKMALSTNQNKRREIENDVLDCFIEDKNLKKIILKSSSIDIIGSYIRTWIDRKKTPYKYEFKTQDGSYFYYNAEELIVSR